MATRAAWLPAKRRFLRVAVPATLALGLVSACSSSSKSSTSSTTSSSTAGVTCSTGSLSGGGSTFVANLVIEWSKNYGKACPGATINYQGIGSGAGITQLTAGTIQFGGTDVPVTADQKTGLDAKGPTVQIAWAAGGIALEYNLSGVSALKLDANTIAGIFANKITKWNDPAITALNSGVSLPNQSIATVHRSDSSGTSAAFTDYMSKTAPTVWTQGSSKTPNWPSGQGAKGSDGVTATVKQTPGAIGYAEVSYAVGGGLPMADVKNAAGQFTSPQKSSAVSATFATAQVASTGVVTVNYATTDPAAYPVVSPTYVVAFTAQHSDLLKNFILYACGPGQQSAEPLYYAPIPQNMSSFCMQTAATITTS